VVIEVMVLAASPSKVCWVDINGMIHFDIDNISDAHKAAVTNLATSLVFLQTEVDQVKIVESMDFHYEAMLDLHIMENSLGFPSICHEVVETLMFLESLRLHLVQQVGNVLLEICYFFYHALHYSFPVITLSFYSNLV
jgi:hypothetical protein